MVVATQYNVGQEISKNHTEPQSVVHDSCSYRAEGGIAGGQRNEARPERQAQDSLRSFLVQSDKQKEQNKKKNH